MKLDIHIGHTKTGTSQFQSLMVNSEKELTKSGILYPNEGRKFGAHHGFVPLLIEQRAPTAGDANTTLEEFREEVYAAAKRGAKRVILSSEAFMVIRGGKTGLEELKDEFDLRVYAFLRPPLSWVNSMMNQIYKNRLYSRSYVDPGLSQLERVEKSLRVSMCFEKRLEVWERLVGRESMVVTNLEAGEDYLTKILDVMGLDLDTSEVKDDSSNKSLCDESLHFLGWLVRSGLVDDHDQKNRFMSLLNEYSLQSDGPRTKNYIPTSLHELAYDLAAKTRALLSERYFGGEPVLHDGELGDGYFNFDEYDPQAVLKVNEYVLSKLSQ